MKQVKSGEAKYSKRFTEVGIYMQIEQRLHSNTMTIAKQLGKLEYTNSLNLLHFLNFINKVR